ncbi:MAG: molybdenum ABC transporter ATP-binding protein [Planctomycetota bacterium]
MIEARVLCRAGSFTLDAEFRAAGQVLGLVGRSGSGKTTLLECLAGLRRMRGRIAVDGRVLCGERIFLPPEKRRLALVPQGACLFPHLSTRGNLTYAPGGEEELRTERGRHLVDVLRLGPLLDRRSDSLSGGERQRVALGRALLSRPDVLLLDEPASALDPSMRREVLALLRLVKERFGVGMVFVTHRPSELLGLADEAVSLEGGRVAATGSPIHVLAALDSTDGLLGADNLLRLPVVSHDGDAGVTSLDLGEGELLRVPLHPVPEGTLVDVGILAEDLILCRKPPGPSSARNAISCRVMGIAEIGAEVLVRLRCGRVNLFSRITRDARRELGLDPGSAVVVLLKTTACRLLGSGPAR